jgi:hypothetical protein
MKYASLCLILAVLGCYSPEPKPASTPVDNLVTTQIITDGGLARVVDGRYGIICYTYPVSGGRSISCLPIKP